MYVTQSRAIEIFTDDSLYAEADAATRAEARRHVENCLRDRDSVMPDVAAALERRLAEHAGKKPVAS
jgi:hypothetical protein